MVSLLHSEMPPPGIPRRLLGYRAEFSSSKDKLGRLKPVALILMATLSLSPVVQAADIDGTSNGGIVNLTEGNYDNVYGIQHVVDEHGDFGQNIASDAACVSLSNVNVVSSVYGGLAAIDVPYSGTKLGNAQASNNSLTITSSAIGGQTFGGFAHSFANSNSGSVIAENNHVTVESSKLSDLLVGGYTDSTSGSSDSISRLNTVEVKNSHTRSLYGAYVGMTMYNEPSASTVIQNNTVNVSDQSVVGSEQSHCYLMGGYVNFSEYSQNTIVSDNNRVLIEDSTTYANIYGSHVRGLMEYQVSGSIASRSTNNAVEILQSTIHLADDNGIVGAYAFDNDDNYHNTGVVVRMSDNSVKMSGSTVISPERSHIYGAYAEVKSYINSSDAVVESNSVYIDSSTVTTEEIIGGISETYLRSSGSNNGPLGDAISNDNKVTLTDSHVETDRIVGGMAMSYGGYASTDGNEVFVSANNNTVEINGGVVSGEVYGGYVFSEKLDDGGANIPNSHALFEVNGNKVILQGDADLSQARLFGSNLQKELTTGNTLLVDGWSGTVAGVENFNKIQLENIRWVDQGTVLEISDPNGSLSGTEINVVSIAAGSDIAEGQRMFLVHGSGDLGTSTELVSVNEDFISGVGVQGEGVLSVDENGNVIYEIQRVGSNPQVQALLKNHSLASAFLNSGFDMVAYGINRLEKENLLGRHVFAVVQGSALEYDASRGMKVNGWNAIYGFGGMSGDFGAAAFFEHGSGNYRLWNMTNVGVVRGSGDLQYQGAGIALKVKIAERISADTAIRAGRLTNGTDNIWADANGNSFGYDMEMPYVAFTVGLKSILYEDCNVTARTRVAYETTWVGSDDFRVADTQFEVAHINFHQARIGAGIDYRASTANTISVYLDYAYEFNAESKGSVQNIAIAPESLKGGTFSSEFLWNFAPDKQWDIDARMRLQTGMVEGVSGLIHLGYRF